MNNPYPLHDSRYYTSRMHHMLQELVTHLREDVAQVDDPRAKALLETSKEVLIGLQTAFEHYEEGSEEAWRR